MPAPHHASVLTAAFAAACHSYSPAPVDLGTHARAFAARLPAPDPARPDNAAVDLSDGIQLAEGRLVATVFHPDCRLARLHAGITQAERDNAGSLPDPELDANIARILESVPHRWLADAGLSFTLPLNGRLGLEVALAGTHHDEALVAAWLTEQRVRDGLDAAWARWSADLHRASLLRELCSRVRELTAVADQLAAAGRLTNQGARAFQLELVQRELELADAETRAALGELAVKAQLGLHPAAEVRCSPEVAVPLHVAEAGTRAATLDTSPRLLPLFAAHRAAEAELELEVRKQWPDLTLRGGWQEEDAQPRAAFGFSLPLPLFNGNDGNIARAAARRDRAAEALRAGYEQAVQELARAERQLAHVEQQQRNVAERLVPLADQQLAEGRQLADVGQLEPLALLDTLGRVHDAHLAAVATTLDKALAIVAINQLTSPPAAPPAAGEPR